MKRSTIAHRCSTCYKLMKNLSGLGRHICKPPAQAPRRRRQEQPSRSTSPPRKLIVHDCADFSNNDYESGLDSLIDNLVDDEPIDSAEATDFPIEQVQKIANVRYTQSELNSGTSYVTELVYYKEDEGIPAGQPLSVDDIIKGEMPRAIPSVSPDQPWWPFVSKHDWTLTSWFARSRCSKERIEEYFKEPEFETLVRQSEGALKSYRAMNRAIYNIPYGIPGGDEWLTRDIIVLSQVRGGKDEKHILRFRPIKQCLEFLLGHAPFASDLVWAPVRKSYGVNGPRVYDEMHTGDWWWDTQAKLPPGATIVPVIIASDKTLMTKLRGDRTAWPVYIQIGNLNRRTRRKQTIPSTLLIGLLPISKEVTKASDQQLSYIIKSDLYHQAMRIIFEPLEELSRTGWLTYCADNQIRHTFPILAPMCIDYEEVCLATGVKNGSQCGKCEVPFNKMQNISKQWPPRTYKRMYDQIQKQEAEKIPQSHPDWVHPIHPFAWRHSLSDIYENISIDMLHQLQKGVFRNLVEWTMELVQDLVPGERASKTKKKIDRTYKESPGLVQLDQRFAAVPVYMGLKHFNKFSLIQQWTGGEERDLIRIWIPVITPLLLDKAPNALAYARALVDFITLAQYRTHNETTLRYMEQALYRIDHTKGAFAKYRPTDKNNEAHWNYPKFHALSHYTSFIQRFGAPNGVDTEHMEAPHKFLLKIFYDRTNKNDEYLTQIASHNSRGTNLKAMEHRLLDFFGTTSKVGVEINAQVTAMPVTPLLLTMFGCRGLSNKEAMKLRARQLDLKTTTIASYAAEAIGLKGFIEALAVFVRTERAKLNNEPIADDKRDCCEKDSSWVHNYPVQLFGSVRCWRRTGKDETNSEAQEDELLRCTPNWRGKGPRGDFCWVQEFPPRENTQHIGDEEEDEEEINPLNGQRVGQLRALLSVLDIGFSTKGKLYYAALVDVYPLKGQDDHTIPFPGLGQPHSVHGMIEVTRAPVPIVDKPQVLKGRRFYALPSILRSAHVIPATNNLQERLTDVFYINNYIDWDQYQTLYEDGWEEKGKERAKKIQAQYEIVIERARASTKDVS